MNGQSAENRSLKKSGQLEEANRGSGSPVTDLKLFGGQSRDAKEGDGHGGGQMGQPEWIGHTEVRVIPEGRRVNVGRW